MGAIRRIRRGCGNTIVRFAEGVHVAAVVSLIFAVYLFLGFWCLLTGKRRFFESFDDDSYY